MKSACAFLSKFIYGIAIAYIIAKLIKIGAISDKAASLLRGAYEKRKELTIALLIMCPSILMNVVYMAIVYTLKDILRDAYNKQVVYTV